MWLLRVRGSPNEGEAQLAAFDRWGWRGSSDWNLDLQSMSILPESCSMY